ncbi:MAG: hypothetical protein DRO15_04505 [Thermoprotei archaeon]|nr:MAG: hypothetical protein DRO15_04505 [Thermoprotei archaeon]
MRELTVYARRLIRKMVSEGILIHRGSRWIITVDKRGIVRVFDKSSGKRYLYIFLIKKFKKK